MSRTADNQQKTHQLGRLCRPFRLYSQSGSLRCRTSCVCGIGAGAGIGTAADHPTQTTTAGHGTKSRQCRLSRWSGRGRQRAARYRANAVGTCLVVGGGPVDWHPDDQGAGGVAGRQARLPQCAQAPPLPRSSSPLALSGPVSHRPTLLMFRQARVPHCIVRSAEYLRHPYRQGVIVRFQAAQTKHRAVLVREIEVEWTPPD